MEFSDNKDHFQIESSLDILFETEYLRQEFCNHLDSVSKQFKANYLVKIVNNE